MPFKPKEPLEGHVCGALQSSEEPWSSDQEAVCCRVWVKVIWGRGIEGSNCHFIGWKNVVSWVALGVHVGRPHQTMTIAVRIRTVKHSA